METQTAQVPTISNIAPVQTAAPIVSQEDIGALLGPVAKRANATLPPMYSQETQVAEPHYHERAPQQTNRPTNNGPITGQVADVKRARRQNAVAGLANTISQAGNMIQERKNNKLKEQLTDVMKAKQNIANATSVLQQDPNNPMAKKVIEANKKQLNDILSDPKTQKQMQKALDISFVDPEKNKTPEVQAYQKAMKEFKEAGPFNADNPAEHKVAEAAKSIEVGGAKPTATSMGSTPTQLPAPAQPNVVQAKSQTPYADEALKRDMPTMEANPQYAAALKQQQDAQKQLSTIIPKLIDNQVKIDLQAARDGNAAAREQFKAITSTIQKNIEIVARAKNIDAQGKVQLQKQAMADATKLKDTTLRVNATLKIADDNRLSKEQSAKIKAGSLEELTKTINVAENSLKTAETNLEMLKASKAPPQAIESAEIQRDIAISGVSGLTTLRAQKFGSYNPAQKMGALLNGSDNESKPEPGTTIDPVGKDLSDEDSDSDSY